LDRAAFGVGEAGGGVGGLGHGGREAAVLGGIVGLARGGFEELQGFGEGGRGLEVEALSGGVVEGFEGPGELGAFEEEDEVVEVEGEEVGGPEEVEGGFLEGCNDGLGCGRGEHGANV
jgi:hypothetical protein